MSAASHNTNNRPILTLKTANELPLPPHNLEAEYSVIGSALHDAEIIPALAKIVQPGDFSRDSYADVVGLIYAMHERGEAVDVVTVGAALEQRLGWKWDRVNEVMTECAEGVPSALNATSYARIVARHARHREGIDVGNQLLKDLYSANGRSELAIQRAAEALARIEGTTGALRPAAGYATLADAAQVIGGTRWLWPDWVPFAVLTLIAAKAGLGKTRFLMWLAKCLWFQLVFPDGTPNPFPAGTPTLWLLVDRNWQETADVATSFGVPLEAVHLCAPKDRPLTVPEIDDHRTLATLTDQIQEVKPGFVGIDTITYATARNTAKPDEVKAAFDGLLNVAADTGAAILALAHLNATGEVLNRRIEERARSVISLSCPDSDQPDRRKLWVSKSAVRKPGALGVTLHQDRNDFDDAPPAEPERTEGKPKGPAPSKSLRHAEWLWDALADGPVAIADLVDAARTDGLLKAPTSSEPKPSISPLYNARDRITKIHPGHEVQEFEDKGRSGKTCKHWRIGKITPEDPV